MRLRSGETLEGMQSVTGKPRPRRAWRRRCRCCRWWRRAGRGSLLSKSAALRVGDDGGGGAVLDDPPGLAHSALPRIWTAGQVRGQRLEADQRRVADAFEDGGSERSGSGDHAAFIFSGIASRPLGLNATSADVRQLIKSNVWHLWQKRSRRASFNDVLALLGGETI